MASMVSEKRVAWMVNTFVERFKQRNGSLRLNVKRLLVKYDLDKSGELDRTELRSALEELLHGITDDEFDAVFRRFDGDGSGAVSIDEFVGACEDVVKKDEEASGFDTASTGGAFAHASNKKDERPRACGLGHRPNAEFEGHGEGVWRAPERQNKSRLQMLTTGDNNDLLELKYALQSKLAELAARSQGGSDLEKKLFRRLLERHRATPLATCLTLPQLRAALGTLLEDSLLDRDCPGLWRWADGGNLETICEMMMPPVEEEPSLLPSKAVKLREALLDKILQTGNDSLRVSVKRLLSKFDTDNSGELDGSEMKKLILELVPGADDAHIADLIADFDTDGSGTLSITECSNALVKVQRAREATDHSLNLHKKKPLYTRAGARGT